MAQSEVIITQSRVAPIDNVHAEIVRVKARVPLFPGDVVYLRTTQVDADLADAGNITTSTVAGIVLRAADALGRTEIIVRGPLFGVTGAGVQAGTLYYLYVGAGIDSRAGKMAIGVAVNSGEVIVPLGRVYAMEDGTRYLYVDIDLRTFYVANP